MSNATVDGHGEEQHEEQEGHELPKGALVLTLTYLVLLTMLWMQVYLQLLNSGGVPR